MIARTVSLGLVATVLVACEQASQRLPFETDPDGPVTASIDPASGGTVTAAGSDGSGISVEFPSGSVPSTTEVTVTRIDGTDLGAPVGGTVLDGTAFSLEPAGLRLDAPARLGIRVDAGSLAPDEQLALDGALVADGGPVDVATTAVDLTSGILRARIDRLGTVGARIADDLLTIVAGTPGEGLDGGTLSADDLDAGVAGDAAAATAGARATTWAADCAGAACLEVFRVIADAGLVERYGDDLGAIDLAGSGELTFTGGDIGVVTGSISVDWELRLRTAGTIAAAPQNMGIDASGSLPYEIRDGRLYIGGAGFGYAVETDGDDRYLILELAPTHVTLRTGDGTTTTVRIAVRVRLREVA